MSIFFLLTVIFIWFMIAYQLILTIAGYFHFLHSMKEKKEIDRMDIDFPKVSILIPARNEEKVIRKTLEAMLALEYPSELYDILVINDGSSDATGLIVEEFVERDPRVRLINIPQEEGGKGKSYVLNKGLKHTDAEYIAVYDADNTPEPSALRYLISQLLLHHDLGAVLGKFRTINREKNILTRFINIETLGFQSILQAGRWKLFKLATLPGTNFVIRRKLLEKLGGWDEEAITEDYELSIRIYIEGYRIKMIPYAITYEQEPERWEVWLKQRSRWVRGNNYVAMKFLKRIHRFKNRLLAMEILYLLSLYYLFFFAIIASDIIFMLGVFNLVVISLPGPYTGVWIFAIILFILELLLALSYEKEDSLYQIFLIILMYFTYCQLWIYVVAKAFYLDFVRKEKRVWVKTIRFETGTESK